MSVTRVTLDNRCFETAEGHGWRIAEKVLEGVAGLNDPLQEFRLCEDGAMLGPSHVSSRDVSLFGGGRYAVWYNGVLFSTSDNSDPTRNGRHYEILLEPRDLAALPFPKTLHVGITSSCNLSCRICRQPNHPNQTLTDQHIDRIVSEIMPHLRWLRLDVSGEPTLHKAKFFRLIDAAERQGVSVFLCTNAALIDSETARRICANKAMKLIQISIDSHDRERLEWVRRGIRYDDFIAGVRNLVAERAAADRRDLRFHFHAALLQNTIDDLCGVVRLAHELGVERVSGYFGFIQGFMDPALSVFWDQARHDARVDEAEALARSLGLDFVIWGRFSQAKNVKPEADVRGVCSYLYQWSYVDSTGLVGPCCIVPDLVLGDLEKNSFNDIWNGDAYNELRITHHTDNPSSAKCSSCYLDSYWDTSRYEPFFSQEHWGYAEARSNNAVTTLSETDLGNE